MRPSARLASPSRFCEWPRVLHLMIELSSSIDILYRFINPAAGGSLIEGQRAAAFCTVTTLAPAAGAEVSKATWLGERSEIIGPLLRAASRETPAGPARASYAGVE